MPVQAPGAPGKAAQAGSAADNGVVAEVAPEVGAVLDGHAGLGVIELDVAALRPARIRVAGDDHRVVDAQDLLRRGLGYDVRLGAEVVADALEARLFVRRLHLGRMPARMVGEQHPLRLLAVDCLFRESDDAGSVFGKRDIVLEDQRGGDALGEHTAVDAGVGKPASDLSRGVHRAVRPERARARDVPADLGAREALSIHRLDPLVGDAEPPELRVSRRQPLGVPVQVDQKCLHVLKLSKCRSPHLSPPQFRTPHSAHLAARPTT